MVTVTGLAKNLDGRRVLSGIDLEVKSGEIMALVGPSGSGKSTLLRCLNRLLEPDEGTITFQGTDIRELPPVTLRRSLVLVPQESVMFPGTVYDNVAYGPALQGTVDHEHVLRCIADAGLPSSLVDRPADRLSGGEKRRVTLARALALRPDILLLDEPTAGVDPKNVETVEQHIVE
ncbi:MAG: ABC transporter ATP-binding protein, partial [Thermoplasmatota archaeon]